MSHILNNVHNLSLIFNKLFQDSKTVLKNLFFFSFSHIFNKISLIILNKKQICFAKFFKLFYIFKKQLFKNAQKFVKIFIVYYKFIIYAKFILKLQIFLKFITNFLNCFQVA